MYETFCKLHDPRVLGRSSHKLTDILILSVLAVICGADTYDAIELFGKSHHEELKKILELPHGIPSHDTINRVFQSINARHFERLFAEWASGLRESGKAGGVVAIDGKTMCGSKDTYNGKSSLHIVSAWSVANALCLGQFKTDDKSNEITAIPNLIEMLDIKGAIVTIDAMGTQKDIAGRIVKAGADYILAVKGNQETLLEDVETMCNFERPSAEDTDVDKGHGRIEVRLCHVFDPDAIIKTYHKDWPELKSVVRVKATRRIGGKETTEVRYYISSLPVGSPFNTYIRNHWEVENKLHWTLDMTFREDQQRKRCKMAAQNFSLVRKFALNVLKKDKSKLSLVNKRLKAAWDWGYLMQLLQI
jgi:predicted transposase YbfD/YdcC